ncbi:MAG: spore coat protein [Oscillospiraceae bacterium]|jgi:spore coat protein CotF|nr:spore coat protein [Oscillospiraceae bacterium]
MAMKKAQPSAQTGAKKTPPPAAARARKTPAPPAPAARAKKAQPTMSMGDKEVITDMLSSQKFLTSTYNTYSGECMDQNLRMDMLDILKDEHNIQNDLFNTMNSRGWYPTKNAPAKEITATLNKFSGAQ